MILQNFQISEDRTELIGISGPRLMQFLRQFAVTHSNQKMYCMKIVEVKHSELARNYLFVILGEYGDETGESTESVEKRFLKKLDDLVRSDAHDLFSRKIFFDAEVLDKHSGEVLEPKLKSISKWSTTAMTRFIDFCILTIHDEMPEFIIPDPKNYMGEREGRKNEIIFPNEKISLDNSGQKKLSNG